MQETLMHVVDHDDADRQMLIRTLQSEGFSVRALSCGNALLHGFYAATVNLSVIDLHLRDGDPVELVRAVQQFDPYSPCLATTYPCETSKAVDAIKAGCYDVLIKPISRVRLCTAVFKCLQWSELVKNKLSEVAGIRARLNLLTIRELEIMNLVVDGRLTKQIAKQLNISPKTVEVHRSNLSKKLEVDSIAQLVRLITTASLLDEFVDAQVPEMPRPSQQTTDEVFA